MCIGGQYFAAFNVNEEKKKDISILQYNLPHIIIATPTPSLERGTHAIISCKKFEIESNNSTQIIAATQVADNWTPHLYTAPVAKRYCL